MGRPLDADSFGERFLEVPDLFPGRAAGEARGRGELRLDIAGGPYRLIGLGERQRETLARRFTPCLLDSAPNASDVPVRLFRAPDEDFRALEEAPRELDLDFQHQADAVLIAGERLMARLDGLPEPEVSLWSADSAGDELPNQVENLLRITAAYRLLAAGGVLLHSAGVRAGEGAWVFVGRSGAGKSTVAGLSAERGLEVLSDELNALSIVEGSPRVERMPFAGDYGRYEAERHSYPLRGVSLLRQGERARVEPASRVEAVAELAAAAPFVNIDPLRT